MNLDKKNEFITQKIDLDDLQLVDELTAAYLEKLENNPNDLITKHLESQLTTILDKHTPQVDDFATNNLPEGVVPDKIEQTEVDFYNTLVDLYTNYIQLYVDDMDQSETKCQLRGELAAKYYILSNRDDEIAQKQLREFAIDLYRESITDDVKLDSFDKAFIKLGILWQNRQLAAAEKKIQNLQFLDSFEQTEEDEIEAMIDLVSDKYLADYYHFLSKIETSPNGYMAVTDFDGLSFKTGLDKFGRFFQPEFNRDILERIKFKTDHAGRENKVSGFINRAFLRAAAFHMGSHEEEYNFYRNQLQLGNAEEFELELILPLVQEKMFLLMKYEEDLKKSRTMTAGDRQSVIDFSTTNRQNLEINDSSLNQPDKNQMQAVENKFRQKDPKFWEMMENAFVRKKDF